MNKLILVILGFGSIIRLNAQDLNFSSEYNKITWPAALGLSGGITGDDGSYKRLALYHGGSISLQVGSNSPSIAYSKLFINSAGQVGIGTTNPSVNLQVDGGSGIQNRLRIASPFVGAEARFDITMGTGSDDLAAGMRGYVPLGQPGYDRVFLGFYTTTYQSGTQSRIERMTISDAGNVGIGTASPAQKFEVAGNVRIDGPTNGFTHSDLEFYRGNGVKFASIGQGDLNSANSTFDIQHFNGNDIRFLNTGTEQLRILAANGNVGIGTASPDYKLTVNGSVHAKEVRVDLTGALSVPDYVFEKDYKLTSLEDIKTYIDQNKHLPEVPSAKEIEKNGVQLGEMNLILLKKIEELTLYMIELKKQNELAESRMKSMQQEIDGLKK